MKAYTFPILLILFFTRALCAQSAYTLADTVLAKRYLEEAKVLIGAGEYDAALGKLDTAGGIYEWIIGEENIEYANVLHQKGSNFVMRFEYQSALEFFQKALDIRLRVLGPKHHDVGRSYNNIGVVYFSTGNYNKAEEYYQKALDISNKTNGEGSPNIATFYNNLGNVYYSKGDYERSIEFHHKALEIRLQVLDPTHLDIGHSYNNLGNAYHAKGIYGSAIDCHIKSLRIRLNTLGEEHTDIATSYNNIGNVYYSKGYYDSSYIFHNKALAIKLKILGTKHLDVGYSYNNMGSIYFSKGNNDIAADYFQRALEIKLESLGPAHPEVANTYNNLGSVYYSMGKPDHAIDFFQKGLNLRLKMLSPGHPDVVNSYYDIGRFYYFKKEYRRSADYFQKTMAAITYQRKNLENPSSRSTLAKESAGVYEGGISTNLLLHQHTDSLPYLHEAFHYAEQSKALSLYESMKNAEALRFAGIPDSLLQQEYDLRVDIAYYEKKRQDLYAEGKEETDTIVLKINSKLFDLKRTYEQLADTFETRYPDYYRLKYSFRTEDVPGIQRDLLQPDQAVLMYHAGDSSVFIFLVTKDDYRVVEVKKDFPLEEWVRQLRHGIYGYRMDSVQHDTLAAFAAGEYTEAAWRLYQKLLAPVDSLLPRQVVVVPDGVLGYVPFEALLTHKPAMPHRFQTHPYFCKQHDLSYCYSATLLREMKGRQHRQKPLLNVTGFAPFFHGEIASQEGARNRGGGWDSLPQSGQEVYHIVKMMGGQSFLGKDAGKEAFLRMAGQGRILHVATHSKSDDQSGDRSFLVFSGDTLYVRDIYNITLNADLVTLSACETGVGELQRGEGIISLARAFSYAGAKSIVTTLWPVDDTRTKDLMIAFYQNLKDGMNKDEALAEARRGFLKTPFAHPFYWAGFVAIGDMGAINAD